MTQFWFRLRSAKWGIFATKRVECDDVECAIMQAYTLVLEALRDSTIRAACSESFVDAVDVEGDVKFSLPFSAVITRAPRADSADPKPVERRTGAGRRVVCLAAARRNRQARPGVRDNAPPPILSEGKVLELPIRRAGGSSR